VTLSPAVKYLLRFLALAYITILVIVPVGLILWRTFAPGVGAFVESITTPAALSALQLSLLVVAIVVGRAYRNGVPLYDKTLQTILGERPCRVIVVSDPSEKPPAIPGAALAEAR